MNFSPDIANQVSAIMHQHAGGFSMGMDDTYGYLTELTEARDLSSIPGLSDVEKMQWLMRDMTTLGIPPHRQEEIARNLVDRGDLSLSALSWAEMKAELQQEREIRQLRYAMEELSGGQHPDTLGHIGTREMSEEQIAAASAGLASLFGGDGFNAILAKVGMDAAQFTSTYFANKESRNQLKDVGDDLAGDLDTRMQITEEVRKVAATRARLNIEAMANTEFESKYGVSYQDAMANADLTREQKSEMRHFMRDAKKAVLAGHVGLATTHEDVITLLNNAQAMGADFGAYQNAETFLAALKNAPAAEREQMLEGFTRSALSMESYKNRDVLFTQQQAAIDGLFTLDGDQSAYRDAAQARRQQKTQGAVLGVEEASIGDISAPEAAKNEAAKQRGGDSKGTVGKS